MTAVLHGQSIETTMGFTPTGGLMMGTRTGDLDPGALLYLMDTRNLSTAEASVLLNKHSGLLGVSGSSSDMRDLLERRATDPAADDAVSLFCYTARKAIGSLAVVLGGLDLLVFTGGIGEHAAPVREEICATLRFLGVELDPERNERHEPIVSTDSGQVTVRVIHTDEESVIARHASRFLTSEGDADV
jgi:acetate kinase